MQCPVVGLHLGLVISGRQRLAHRHFDEAFLGRLGLTADGSRARAAKHIPRRLGRRTQRTRQASYIVLLPLSLHIMEHWSLVIVLAGLHTL